MVRLLGLVPRLTDVLRDVVVRGGVEGREGAPGEHVFHILPLGGECVNSEVDILCLGLIPEPDVPQGGRLEDVLAPDVGYQGVALGGDTESFRSFSVVADLQQEVSLRPWDVELSPAAKIR